MLRKTLIFKKTDTCKIIDMVKIHVHDMAHGL
jgi:hypothetical protein